MMDSGAPCRTRSEVRPIIRLWPLNLFVLVTRSRSPLLGVLLSVLSYRAGSFCQGKIFRTFRPDTDVFYFSNLIAPKLPVESFMVMDAGTA